jgi:hypothetical protein
MKSGRSWAKSLKKAEKADRKDRGCKSPVFSERMQTREPRGPQPPLTDLKVKMTIEKEKNSRGIQTKIPCISPFRVGE